MGAEAAGPQPSLSDAGKKGNEVRWKGISSDNVTGDRGNSSSYLARRILRDRKDIFEDLKAGKYPSVRAAAKAAGTSAKTERRGLNGNLSKRRKLVH